MKIRHLIVLVGLVVLFLLSSCSSNRPCFKVKKFKIPHQKAILREGLRRN